MLYRPDEYLKDRNTILDAMATFRKHYPGHDINMHTGPARLAAINKEYCEQFNA